MTFVTPIRFTIRNIYLSNGKRTYPQLFRLISQLPPSFLIGEDFNAHSNLWGSQTTDAKCRRVESLLEDINLFLVNTGEPDFLNARSYSFFHIDLSFRSSVLASTLSWKVSDDLHSSDHFSIHISIWDSQRIFSYP